MKPFEGYKEATETVKNAGGAKLPKGGYKGVILGVKHDEANNVLIVQFDITEGEYKDFFKKQFDANTSENKKYKGQTRIYLPKDDGSESDTWTKNTFARWTTSLEESNKGYVWDWDETKWKGKKIGLVFGETGTNIEGKNVVYTELHYPVAIDKVKDVKPEKIKFKAKKGYKADANGSSDFVNVSPSDEAELPF